ncbi:MAG TPA: HAD family phosphatase [Chloroflexia bacterium]|nr:HAD family phosphatase [Chloroflexia bacterium]
MPSNRAVVWDLDGVIVDSAEAQNASWVAMAQEFGVPYDAEKDFKAIFGRHNTDIMNLLWKVTDAEEVERMVQSKEGHFRRNATTLCPLPGVLELMDALRKTGWRQAIGSSAPIENVKLLVEVTGIAQYIEAIASGDDVTEGKPNPRVFLLAFERLGVEPRDGVVIEDAPAGIQAGVRSGAATLGVTTTQTEETLMEAGAHMVVRTLAEVGVADLERLIEERQRL